MSDPDNADFVLAHGTEAIGLPSGNALPMDLRDLELVLQACSKKGIPMIVANPDFVTVEARALRVMPGEKPWNHTLQSYLKIAVLSEFG